ncbi:hypothetical protein [Nitrosopumilus spindle-shaped virus]|uniref:Uncharacterized protein n=1 Tax=Nitrosopumilus spindle-shaped virus TaxID=2508184 RepID=A0A514K375_9VIRU|nr:hypothetical protein [Nitrosopumilus spindle-shaped virus]
MELKRSERKFVEKLEAKGLSPDEIEKKLRNRRKAKKILYFIIPTLGVATYILIYAAMKTQELSWFFMTPPT